MLKYLVNRRRFSLVIILTWGVIACGDENTAVVNDQPTMHGYNYSQPQQNDDGWLTSSLTEQSINQADIESLLFDVQRGLYPGFDGLVIIRNNYLVLDVNFRASLDAADVDHGNQDLSMHSQQSVTKSIASLLIGIAKDQGYIGSINDQYLSFFPEYNDIENLSESKQAITLSNALTMRHGLNWDESSYAFSDPRNTLSAVMNTYDVVKSTLDLPMASVPGSRFAYSSGVSITLGKIVSNSTGVDVTAFADENLFLPLNIQDKYWSYTQNGTANTGYGLFLKPRDMAKIGQMVLDKGRWQGQQIVSEEWINLSTQEQSSLGQWGTTRIGYAMQWWTAKFMLQGSEIPAVFANGNGGQRIYILPTLNTVIIFTSRNYSWLTSSIREQPNDIMSNRLLGAIK
jgi:CubicO group peptidase (beta-lactamase class C family)